MVPNTQAAAPHTLASHLILIHVAVQQLLVAAVDDRGAVAGSKHVGGAAAAESPQGNGLRPQAERFAVVQHPCLGGEGEAGEAAISQCAQEVVHALKVRQQDAAGNDLR